MREKNNIISFDFFTLCTFSNRLYIFCWEGCTCCNASQWRRWADSPEQNIRYTSQRGDIVRDSNGIYKLPLIQQILLYKISWIGVSLEIPLLSLDKMSPGADQTSSQISRWAPWHTSSGWLFCPDDPETKSLKMNKTQYFMLWLYTKESQVSLKAQDSPESLICALKIKIVSFNKTWTIWTN